MATKITAVNPLDAADPVATRLVLRWADSGSGAFKYKVYFDDTEASVTNKAPSAYRGDVYNWEYDPALPLDYGIEYFWKIVPVDADGVQVAEEDDSGDLSFTTASAPTAQADARYSTLLCCAADDKFYYEDKTADPPAMVALDPWVVTTNETGLKLDTSVPITMWEAYQRVFIVNGIYKKVVDFVNTRLSVSGITTPPTRGDVIIGTDGGAQMLVDFVPKTEDAIYGSVLSGTFTTSDGLSGGTLSGTITVSAVDSPNDADPPVPFHYDWTPYADINTTLEFGAIPDFLYSGCLFMGSCLFGNNPLDPHFWGMTRQGNPFDFAYGSDDVQSAVAAGGSVAGKIGDRVLTFIPLSADYILLGCARSWMIMRGLPAGGGQLDLLDDTVGIIDKDAWCKGTNGDLYFLAKTGLYRIQGISKPMPLSHDVIPRLAEELALNPETQRITMGYDRNRHGLIICASNITTGANSAYWYDLHTSGFFPEEYPTTMTPFSQLFADAEDPDYRQLLFGSNDGYLRTFDDDEKSDDGRVIASHVLIGPERIGLNDSRDGLMNDMQIVTAGGDAGGSMPDSDDIQLDVFVGDSAEACLEKAI